MANRNGKPNQGDLETAYVEIDQKKERLAKLEKPNSPTYEPTN